MKTTSEGHFCAIFMLRSSIGCSPSTLAMIVPRSTALYDSRRSRHSRGNIRFSDVSRSSDAARTGWPSDSSLYHRWMHLPRTDAGTVAAMHPSHPQ